MFPVAFLKYDFNTGEPVRTSHGHCIRAEIGQCCARDGGCNYVNLLQYKMCHMLTCVLMWLVVVLKSQNLIGEPI